MHRHNSQATRAAIGRVLQPFIGDVSSFLGVLSASDVLLTGSILAPIFEPESLTNPERRQKRLELLSFQHTSTPLVNFLWAEGYRPSGVLHHGFILVRTDGFVISLTLVREKDLRLRSVSSLQDYYIHTPTSAHGLYFMTGKYAVQICSEKESAADRVCSPRRGNGTLTASSAELKLPGCSNDAKNGEEHDSKAVCQTRLPDNRFHRVLFFGKEDVEVKGSAGRQRPVTDLDTLRDSHKRRLQHEHPRRDCCPGLDRRTRRKCRISRNMPAPSSES